MTKQPPQLNINTQLGRLYARAGKWARAERMFARAVLEAPTPTSFYYLGNAQFKCGKFPEALAATERAVALDGTTPAWLLRLGALNEKQGNPVRALQAYETALELEPANAEIKKRVEKMRKRVAATSPAPAKTPAAPAANKFTGFNLAEVQTLQEGSLFDREAMLTASKSVDPKSRQWLFHYGTTLLRSGKAVEAITHLEAALAADPLDAETAHFLNLAYLGAGDHDRVREAFVRTLQGRHRPEDFFGSASFFAERGELQFAAELYKEYVLAVPGMPALWFQQAETAMALHDWATAQQALMHGLALSPAEPHIFYTLGLCLERQGNFLEASNAYAAAIRLLGAPQPEWTYRYGYVLAAAENTEAALTAFKRMYPQLTERFERAQVQDIDMPIAGIATELLEQQLDSVLFSHDPELLLAAGKRYLQAGLIDSAAKALQAASRQDPAQESPTYFLLGLAYSAAGDQSSAISAFLDTRAHSTARLQAQNSSSPAKPLQDSTEYVHFLQDLPLEENLVLFESYHGSKIDCNPAAIYRQLRSDPNYDHLRFAWVITGKTRVPKDVRDDARVSLVSRGSRLYRRALASAKYLVSNVSFPNYFVRRDGQQYLNTWHGTPLKALGRDIAAGFMEHGNVSRNLLQTTHLLAPNRHTQDSLIKRYEVEGLFTGQIARLGSPRIDRMLNQDEQARREILVRLGLPDDGKKIVFYAPTWRGTAGNRNFDATQLVNDLEGLSQDDYHVVFRAHHLTEAALKNVELSASVVPSDIDTYDVLALTDLLVTDYSSIFFDFLPLRRPIVFHVYDLAEYTEERGLYFDMASMPGELATNTEELRAAIARGVSSGIQDPAEFDRAIQEYAPSEDGNAAARAVAFFLASDSSHVVQLPADERNIVLIRHNFKDAANTAALREAMDGLDPAEFRVVVTFDRAALFSSPQNQEELASLPAHVQRVMRAGGHVLSSEERLVLDRIDRQRALGNDAERAIARTAFQREYRRTLGLSHAAFAVIPEHRDATGLAFLGGGGYTHGRLLALLPDELAEYYVENGTIGSASAHWLGETQATHITSLKSMLTTALE